MSIVDDSEERFEESKPNGQIHTTRRERPVSRDAGMIGVGILLLGAAALVGRASRRRIPRKMMRRTAGSSVGRVAGNLGRGFVAGMAGTFAITTASTIDTLVTEAFRARKEGRKPVFNVGNAIVNPWSFSSGVVGKVFGITPTDPQHDRRLGIIAHWEYGSTWGLSLPLIHAMGLHGLPAAGAVLGGQLTAEMFVMPSFKLFSGPSEWGTKAIVSSIYQHAIYAVAAEAAYDWLSVEA